MSLDTQFSSSDILNMKFKLDNTLRSKIRKPVKVMWVRGRIVGTQFNERKLYEKGFGILSEFINFDINHSPDLQGQGQQLPCFIYFS